MMEKTQTQKCAEEATLLMWNLIHYGMSQEDAIVKGYEMILFVMQRLYPSGNPFYVVQETLAAFGTAMALLESELQQKHQSQIRIVKPDESGEES